MLTLQQSVASASPASPASPPAPSHLPTPPVRSTAHSASTPLLRRLPAVLLACLVLALSVDLTEGARRKGGGKRTGKKDEAYKVLKWIYICLFGPVILYFLYLVLRDPMTPHVLHELWCRAKEKTGAFLGRDREAQRLKSRRARTKVS